MKTLTLNISPKEAGLLLSTLDCAEAVLLASVSAAVAEGDDTDYIPEVTALREFIVAAHGLRLVLDLGDEA